MNEATMTSEIKEIAFMLNILVVDDEIEIKDISKHYIDCRNGLCSEFVFETETSKSLFYSLINSAFALCSNYRLVFPEVIYK